MNYTKSKKYQTKELMSKIMGPNPIKLLEELMSENKTDATGRVMDLGSGQGLTSVFLAKEYGFHVYAADLWSEPNDNQKFFMEMGLGEEQIKAVKADAENLPFEKDFFDGIVTVDSYHYFGRDENILDEKILPCLKSGGYMYIAIPGMKKDCHENLPEVLLRSWTAEDLETMHDVEFWSNIVGKSKLSDVVSVKEMKSNEEVWDDWLKQENEYAVGDRKTMNAGGGKYLNFISIILKKK